jgi:hypothetical protein
MILFLIGCIWFAGCAIFISLGRASRQREDFELMRHRLESMLEGSASDH